ncbi:hypothetical protein NE237_016313 [Protea cynaroides]|uniref:TIR domain-containing protein n=1 Tax=Protea cynaroides TaxID=273540 RepID=A0A9Q0JS65_9MAGN|nr:hypothetical protein NE237_016313 [Protea cynaroides]
MWIPSSLRNSNCNFMAAQVGSFEAFINYNWKDTGNNFTHTLYEYLRVKGIDVFRDGCESLRRGEEMLPLFLNIIESSKILIPVILQAMLKANGASGNSG